MKSIVRQGGRQAGRQAEVEPAWPTGSVLRESQQAVPAASQQPIVYGAGGECGRASFFE